jgi:mitotic spindle assembly checkpoint protein MAD2
MGGDGSEQVITLRGSTETVVEFFGFAINSILYQRGVCAAEKFAPVSKYGLSILVTKDKELQEFIGEVMQQLRGWMQRSQVKKLVIVIASQTTGETLERWAFDVQVSEEAAAAGPEAAVPRVQADAVREQKEIQAIIRQITASVTFLPLLDEPCSFDLLVYTDKAAEVPQAWDESDPKYISGGQQEVRLRSFSTKIHKVEGAVAYRFPAHGGC